MVTITVFRHKGEELTAEVLEDKGSTLRVRVFLDGGQTKDMTIKPAQVATSWFEEDVEGEPSIITCTTTGYPPKAPEPAPEPEEGKDPEDDREPGPAMPEGSVLLKTLCTELGVAPRVARRRLRKAFGLVGTGKSWYFTPDRLAEARKAIGGGKAATVVPAPEPEPEAEDTPEAE
jgi:hypothetical protein